MLTICQWILKFLKFNHASLKPTPYLGINVIHVILFFFWLNIYVHVVLLITNNVYVLEVVEIHTMW